MSLNHESIAAARRAFYYELYVKKSLPPEEEKGVDMKLSVVFMDAGEHLGNWWFEATERSPGMRVLTKGIGFIFSWAFFVNVFFFSFLYLFLHEFINFGMTKMAIFMLIPVSFILVLWVTLFFGPCFIQYDKRRKRKLN